MRLVIFVILCLYVAELKAQSGYFGNETDELGRNIYMESRLKKSTTVVQSDLKFTKFMAYIFNKNTLAHLGSGVVVHKNWVVTLTSAVNTIVAGDLRLTFDAMDPTIGGHNRNVILNIPNPDCATNNFIDCISLLKFCPSVTPDHIIVLSPLITPYRDEITKIRMLVYQLETDGARAVTVPNQPLMYLLKNIGETCECDLHPKWVEPKHICLHEDAVSFGVDGGYDLKGLAIVNLASNEFVGFLVKAQGVDDIGGEIVFYAQMDKTWIYATAV